VGLVGSASPSSSSFALAQSSDDNFGNVAEWSIDGSLKVRVLTDTQAGQTYTIAIVLKNPNYSNPPQSVSVSTSGIAIGFARADEDLDRVPDKVHSRLCKWKPTEEAADCGRGDAAPLKVYAPGFLRASVTPSTVWPGATNELTVDLVANTDMAGDLHSTLTVSKMTGLHDQMQVAPFIVGNVREGAYCGQDPNAARDRFVMYTAEHVRERFSVTHPDNADHFVCVQVEYTFENRTYSSWNNESVVVNVSKQVLVNNTFENRTMEVNASQQVLVNTSEWVMMKAQWRYYNGETWESMLPVPTDVLVANVSAGVRGMQASENPDQPFLVAGIVAGLVGSRSDIVFTRGDDDNVKIEGDFLTPPLVALTSKVGPSHTVDCVSTDTSGPGCTARFASVSPSAKLTIEVLNIDFNSDDESLNVTAGGVLLGAHLLKDDGVDNACNRWSKVIDAQPVSMDSLVNFDKFNNSGELEIALTTTPDVGDVVCGGYRLHARITVETPAWDLFGWQADPGSGPHDNQERVWNEWPSNAPNPAGTAPWIQPGKKTLIGSGSFSTAAGSGGMLGLEMRRGKSLRLGERLSFSFMVLNSLAPHSPYDIFLSAAGDCASISDTAMQGQLEVVSPAFIIARAVQSSPFPCSFNTITIALISNVHLRKLDGSTLVLSGFSGAYASDGEALELSDASGGARHNEVFSARWTQGTNQVDLTVLKNVIGGREYRFAFEVDNPIVKPDSPNLMEWHTGKARSSWDSPALTMTANGFSAVLHEATSSPSVGAFNADITSVDAPLGLCGNSKSGDAAPLYIYPPAFTVANVSQASAFPCDTNTISVTFRSNVPLCAKDCFAQITISNLVGAVADDGPLQLSSVDAAEKNTFAAAPKGTPGFGKWSQADHELTLYLTCCMECNKDYRISFSVRNHWCVNQAPDIMIGVANSEAAVAIPRTLMTSSSRPLPLGGQEAALGIIQPQFVGKSIEQSSSAPCDSNTITVSLATNVPIDAGTKITISGLTQSQTNSTSQMPVYSDSNTTSCLNSTGVWDEESGELVVQVNTSWSRRGDAWDCIFSFTLDNPAKELQGVVPLVTATICAEHDPAAAGCPVTSNQMTGTVMVVSPLDFEARIWQSSPFPCDVNTITVSLTHKVVDLLSICNPTITISGLDNAVHDDGVIEISDIRNDATKNGTWSTSVAGGKTQGSVALELSDLMPADDRDDVFHFSFEVTNPNFAQAAPAVQVEANIHDRRTTPPVLLQANHQNMPPRAMVPPTPTEYDFETGQDGRPVPYQTQDNTSDLVDMVKNESGVLKSGAISAVDFTGKAVSDWWYTCRNTEPGGSFGKCVKFADNHNDRKPLFVRKIFFIKNRIGQSNAEPCSHLTITVTLETSVPLLTRCHPAITLSGLSEAVELEPAVVNVSQAVDVKDFAVAQEAPAAPGSFAMHTFDRAAGKMVLNITNDTMAGVTYEISFTLRHRAEASDGVDVVVSMEHVESNAGDHLSQASRLAPQNVYGYTFEDASYALQPGPGDAKPMKVKELQYRSYAGQTSIHPCDNNTIWVWLEAVNLKVLYSCAPVVTISGLMNTQTPSSTIDVTNVHENDATVTAAWSNSGSTGEGSLLLNLTKLFSPEAASLAENNTEDSYKTEFLFHFTITNPAQAQNDNQPTLGASISREASSQAYSESVRRFTWTKRPTELYSTLLNPARTMDCTSESDSAPSCSVTFMGVDPSAPLWIAIDVKMTDFNASSEYITNVAAGGHNMTLDRNLTSGGADDECDTMVTIVEWVQLPASAYSTGSLTVQIETSDDVDCCPCDGDYLFAQVAISPSDLPVTGYDLPVTVRPLQFLDKRIRQSTPYPCDDNEIIVELRTNVKLLARCTPHITVTGLEGSYTQNSMELAVSVFDSIGSISGAATWVQGSGTLELPLTEDVQALAWNAFSFVLQNPSKNPPAVTVSLEGSLDSFFPSRATKMTASAEMVKSTGTAPAGIYKSGDAKYADRREASPLVVRNLEYEVKKIRQVSGLLCLFHALEPCATSMRSEHRTDPRLVC